MKKILALLLTLHALLFADFQSIKTAEFEALVKNGAPIIDIRTPDEWKEGVVPGSHKIMFFNEKGDYNVDKFLMQFAAVVKDKNQPFILVCRTASRTKVVGQFLANQMGYTNTKELAGGIMWGWSNFNKPVEK